MNTYLVINVTGLNNYEPLAITDKSRNNFAFFPNKKTNSVVVVAKDNVSFLRQLYDGYFENLGFSAVYKIGKEGYYTLKLKTVDDSDVFVEV